MQELVENQKLVRTFLMEHPSKRGLHESNPFQKSSTNDSFVRTAYESVSGSFLLQLAVASVLVVFVTVIYRVISRCRKNARARSGPKSWPIIGSMFAVYSNYDHMHDWLVRCFVKISTVCAPMPFGRLYYCTVDPANVKHLLDMNINYRKGKGFFKRMEVLLGKKEFHDSYLMRRWTASEFSEPSTAEMNADALKKRICTVARVLSEVAFEAGKVDVQELLRRASLDAAGEVALGIDFASVPNSLRSAWPESHTAVSGALDSATEIVIRRFSDPLWELKRYFNIGREAILRKQIQVVNGFIHNIITERKFKLAILNGQLHGLTQAYPATAEGTPANVHSSDLTTKFLSLTMKDENHEHSQTDDLLRHVVVNFMVASRDATAATMTWFVYMMSQNAPVAHKLYEELREFHARTRSPCEAPLMQQWDEDLDIDTYTSVMTTRIADFANLLTFESLDELPYLHACVQETLRLYPVVPLDPMDIEADDILPEGYTLKARKGNMIFIAPYAMARLISIWGPDAASFNPERWLQKGKFVPESEFKFVTFQAGLYTTSLRDLIYRNCKVAAAILGRFFEFVYAEPLNRGPQYHMTSTLLVNNGLKVYARLRD